MYATLTHVQALNPARQITATSLPNASQVAGFIEQVSAEIDGVLRQRGYALPIPSTATSALKLLEHMAAVGAACMVEKAAPTTKRDSDTNVCAMWKSAMEMLKAGELELDAPADLQQSLPRAAAAAATPFFTRDLEF